MNNELGLFKRDFLEGGLIWLKAEHSFDAICLAEELVSLCEFNLGGVLKVSASHFIQLSIADAFALMKDEVEVVLIYGFERISDYDSQRLLMAVRYFRAANLRLGMKLVLASCEMITPSLGEFGEFSPLSVLVKGRWGVDSMDTRIHGIIERAAFESNQSVKKITERAAVFLECVMASEKDEDIYSLISAGLGRFDGNVLRFRDLVPNLRQYFGEKDELDGAF